MSSAVAEKSDTSLTRVDQSTEDDYIHGYLNASSGWQDDLCMEPITPVPGFSKLCNACIKIFRDLGKGNPWFGDIRHIRYSAVLASSARRGCRLCALLLTDIQKRASCLQIVVKSIIDLHFSITIGGFASKLSFSGTELSSWRFTLSMYPVEGSERPWISSRPVSAMDSLISNQSLARRWFRLCRTTHSRCRPRSCDTNFPTRLLEIDGSGKHTSVRVITTDRNPRAGEYMTLSHCWGASQFITLREDNLAELGHGIELERLPKTFQDAVVVAQWFGIRYLWIDSLCILQDSQEDWVKESATMRSVYSRSIMNISATGAVDPSIGCFLDRKPENLRPFSALLSGSERYGICSEDNSWQVNITDAPLSKRAWAFQERLLSPRILHFGAIQMAWECMESASCETFPEGVPNIGHLSSVITKREFFDHTRGFFDMWNTLVTYYTNCAMTVPSDIYMAFAGVAEEIHSLTADNYFAGFWRKNLELQLLWVRVNSATWKPTGYRAPSWSWFSVNGAVRFPWLSLTRINEERLLYKVLDVIVHNSTEDLYGPVTYGCLRCRGILGTAVRQTGNQHWVIQPIHGQRLECKDTLEWDHKTDLSKREVTYLPVLNFNRSFVLALLLEPTHVKEGEYQRIGIWGVEGEDNCRNVLCEQMPGNGAWVDRPQQIFTIV